MLAALLVFRLFYLIIPLVLGIIVVLAFEHSQFGRARKMKIRSENRKLLHRTG